MSFTCITCRVVFDDPEVQRNHYKSEWHRYNLKRKVAELPPITEERFLEKESQQKTEDAKQNLATYCAVCRKNFASQNAREAHQKSKKHQMAVKMSTDKNNRNKWQKEIKSSQNNPRNYDITSQQDDDDEVVEEDDDDDEWESCDEIEESTAEVCPFCSCRNENVEANLRHMTLRHSFFVPDPEYVIDISGLISHLNRKMTEEYVCLWCGRCFGSAEAVQRHVADSGHAKIQHEGDGLLEFADFYDYSSSYPEGEHPVEPVLLEDEGWELVLPSGTRVGHRSLARYYRQNLRPRNNQREEKSKRLMSGMTSCYRALGWTGTTGKSAVSKARDICFARRVQSRRALKLGVQNNKLQHHFRLQVVF